MPAPRRAPDTTTFKPLKPAVFHILLALAARDNYGYAVMQAVRDASDGHVPLSPGSFYRHLARLIDDGLVAEAAARRAGDDPRRGAYYRLTASRPHACSRDERRRLAALVAAIDGLRLVPRRGRRERHRHPRTLADRIYACCCCAYPARVPRSVRRRDALRLRRDRESGHGSAGLRRVRRASGSPPSSTPSAPASRSDLNRRPHRPPERTPMKSWFVVDWRDGWRSLRATPVVTAVAVLSLALGIGANTALFSIFNSLMLKPLPVPEPDRLVLLDDDSWTNPIWEADPRPAGSDRRRRVRLVGRAVQPLAERRDRSGRRHLRQRPDVRRPRRARAFADARSREADDDRRRRAERAGRRHQLWLLAAALRRRRRRDRAAR